MEKVETCWKTVIVKWFTFKTRCIYYRSKIAEHFKTCFKITYLECFFYYYYYYYYIGKGFFMHAKCNAKNNLIQGIFFENRSTEWLCKPIVFQFVWLTFHIIKGEKKITNVILNLTASYLWASPSTTHWTQPDRRDETSTNHLSE